MCSSDLSLITTGVCSTSFLLNGAGGIVCTWAAEVLEDVDEEDGIPAVPNKQIGHGFCTKTGSTCYRAE